MSTALQPTPAAPAPVQRSFNETINKVSQQTSIPATPVVEKPVVQIVKDIPKESVAADSAATPTDKVPPITDAPAAETAPVAPDAATPPVDAAPLEPTSELSLDDGTVILRAERNADGTFKTKFDPAAKLDFEIVLDKKTGEKKQFSKTLPEIVRLAKDGVTLQQKVQTIMPEVQYYRENVPKWQDAERTKTQTLSALQQAYQDMEALNRELLSADDATVIAHRERYQSEMSPQKVAERELAALKQQQADMQRQMQTTQAQTFIQSRLAPALAEANAVLGEDTVAGIITRTFNGPIPPHEWSKVEQFVNGPLKQRVTDEKSKQEKAKAEAAATAAATKAAQASAQRAVNDAGRATVPIGSAAPDRAPAAPKPTNMKGVMDKLINRPLPQTVGSLTG